MYRVFYLLRLITMGSSKRKSIRENMLSSIERADIAAKKKLGLI